MEENFISTKGTLVYLVIVYNFFTFLFYSVVVWGCVGILLTKSKEDFLGK